MMTNEKIRERLSLWVGELFDDNFPRDKVNSAVEMAVNKIAAATIRNENIDEKKMLEIFKKVISEL